MNKFFPKSKSLGANLKDKLDLSNYETKADFKNVTGVYQSDFSKTTDLPNLKS